ncbi:type II toxin-antitoxin system Phd/YefM family antitoxin [bacterium]|nr:type II toxin-antitoxin system Phd/YefM family antitoxin [bacterium]
MNSERMQASELRAELRDVLNRVEYNKVRVQIHRRGKVAGVLVPLEDYELMESMLDKSDAAAARKALADLARHEWKDIRR